MSDLSPGDGKEERKKRREAAVKEVNQVAKGLGGIDPVAIKNMSGVTVAAFFNKVFSDTRLGAADKAVLQAARNTMVRNRWENVFEPLES